VRTWESTPLTHSFLLLFILLIYFLERTNQVISLKTVFSSLFIIYFFKYIFIFILLLLFNL